MAKFLFLFLVLFTGLAGAADATGTAVPVASGVDWHALLQQIAVNGGLMLLSFLVGMIPVVGTKLKAFVDFWASNMNHKDTPPATK